jgi:hypothetical protein
MTTLRHPTRRAVLRIVLWSHKPCSPVELAEEMNDNLNNVGYHVRQLHRREALRLVGTEPVLGALKHYYVPGRLIHRNRALVMTVLGMDGEPDDVAGT